MEYKYKYWELDEVVAIKLGLIKEYYVMPRYGYIWHLMDNNRHYC